MSDTPAQKLSRSKRAKPLKWSGPWICALREKRTALRLTIAEVAKEVGLSSSTVFEAENGGDPMLTTAFKLANFYGLEVTDLWKATTKRKG